MSKIIKRSTAGKPVTIDRTPLVQSYDLPELVKKKSNVRNALDFKHRIESSVTFWRDKALDHLTTVEEDRKTELDQKFDDGYSQGHNDGVEQEHAERDQYIDSKFGANIKNIEALLEEAKRVQEEATRNLEKKIVDLSIAIAETIIKRSIEADSSIIEEIVRESMTHIITSEKLILKVSAEDYTVINDNNDKWFGMAGNVKEFRIEVDKRLSPGDCLIETEGGIIDATVRSRLGLISEELIKIHSI